MGSNGKDAAARNAVADGKAERRRAELVAARLTPWLVELFGSGSGRMSAAAFALDRPEHESVALKALRELAEDERLHSLLTGRAKRKEIEQHVIDLLRCNKVDLCSADLFWATWAGEWPVDVEAPRALSLRRLAALPRKTGRWVKRKMAAALLWTVIGGVVGVAWSFVESKDLSRIELFAVAVLSFFPGWLFVRFVGFRAGAVWDEYVLNLHRLGADLPEHLPRPPTNSLYHDRWVAAGGPLLARQPTIYQQKFEAYYGRRVASTRVGEVKTDALFPVYLMTAVIAVGWTAVLAGLDLFGPTAPPAEYSTPEMMAFAFLGSYTFFVQMLVRRFFQADLKPSAYATGLVRVTVAMGVVAVLHRADLLKGEPGLAVAAAFVVGSFPLVGLQALQRAAATVLKGVVPVLDFTHPLSDVEGLSIWYEARLLEEGIEDMQNLVTANLPEVMLHTRVPVGRLVDWLDQAHLALRLPPLRDDDRQDPTVSPNPRFALLNIGVRTATGFLEAFPLAPDGWELTPAARSAAAAITDSMNEHEVATLARVLDAEPALETIWHWRCWKDSVVGQGRQHCHRGRLRQYPDLLVVPILDGVGDEHPAGAEAQST
jgi:hypothetical protein